MSLISLPSPYKESDITQPPELRPACDLIWEEERGTHCRSCFQALTRTPIIFLRVVGLSSVYCSLLEIQTKAIRRFVITEKAPTRSFSWLKLATTAFTFKTLLRHYAEWALTPRSLNVKLGLRRKGHKGQRFG